MAQAMSKTVSGLHNVPPLKQSNNLLLFILLQKKSAKVIRFCLYSVFDIVFQVLLISESLCKHTTLITMGPTVNIGGNINRSHWAWTFADSFIVGLQIWKRRDLVSSFSLAATSTANSLSAGKLLPLPLHCSLQQAASITLNLFGYNWFRLHVSGADVSARCSGLCSFSLFCFEQFHICRTLKTQVLVVEHFVKYLARSPIKNAIILYPLYLLCTIYYLEHMYYIIYGSGFLFSIQ